VFRVNNEYYYVFSSKSQAHFTEALLRQKGYNIELRPTPGMIGKGCSYSLVFKGDLADARRIREHILARGIAIKGVYQQSREGQYIRFVKVM
jgi:hypothetical protein